MQTISNEITIDVQLPSYFGGHFNYNPLLHDEHFIYIHTHLATRVLFTYCEQLYCEFS